MDHLIVDEYQDVNFGQQTLIEILAGKRAEVMVVGDDDQTIYEWRGARPDFILERFNSAFPGRKSTTYKLSRSFRFGPSIAKHAYNAISHNKTRVEKKIVAHDKRKKSKVNLLESTEENRESVHHIMANEIKRLMKKKKVPASEIWVLGRMYAQLSIFESQCLATGIPYRVLGSAPFFKRSEVGKILDYLRTAISLDEPITSDIQRSFLSIVNSPNRYLKRSLLKDTLSAASKNGFSIRLYLNMLAEHMESENEKSKQRTIKDFLWVLSKAQEMAKSKRSRNSRRVDAGSIMKWIMVQVNYQAHFKDYYGDGEDAFERMETLRNFTDFAQSLDMRPVEFLNHMKSLDSRQGASEEALVTMTTVHKTKGLEFDYVFIPSCQEGYMPCLLDTPHDLFDTEGKVHTGEPSDMMEGERRLFYVALTRARKAVYIGTKHPDKKEAQDASIPSRFILEMQGG